MFSKYFDLNSKDDGLADPLGPRLVFSKEIQRRPDQQQMQIHMHIRPQIMPCENARPSEGLKIAC
jgi:hypothetical protein